MQIHGFQKMTLLDFPGKVACTVFTGGCNFRCPFCHNALLVTELADTPAIAEDEVIFYLEKRRGLLDGVCVTGGEPLLQPDIADFLTRLKDMGYAVKLDTNGSFPQKLQELVKAGLVDHVAMDVKNSREKYAETIGVPGYDLSKVEQSIAFLLSGAVSFEFRTTVVKEFHTVEDIAAIAEWIRGTKAYFLQNFTDSGNLIGHDLHAVSKETMLKMQQAAAVFVPDTALRGL